MWKILEIRQSQFASRVFKKKIFYFKLESKFKDVFIDARSTQDKKEK